jgi:hypothetical protein
MMHDDDLASLPPVEPPRALALRVRRMAHKELAAAPAPRWRAIAAQAFTRVALPAAVTVTVAGYLHWAVQAASALYR